MGRSWRIKDTESCVFCDSDNVEHWIAREGRVVVHKCMDCKQTWTDNLNEEEE